MPLRSWVSLLAGTILLIQESTSQHSTSNVQPSSSSVCGTAPLNTRIVGGQNASPGNWPWQASLVYQGGHICGGSLVNKQWVMTAAHCFHDTSRDLFDWSIYLGLQSHLVANPNQVHKAVSGIVLNPNYNRFTTDGDIALVKLVSSATFNNFIRPVCLAALSSVFYTGVNSWVTGWGYVREGVPEPSPLNLQEVQVPVMGNRQCNCLTGVGSITGNMICAGLMAGGKDACQGDSGGPMVIKKNTIWVQAGIVSFGDGCARPKSPGVYTRVSNYQSWILSLITIDPPGFVHFSSSGVNTDSSYTCPGLY